MIDACFPRSRSNLLAAVAAEHVETAPDLQKDYGGPGWTHCNLFVERVCQRLGSALFGGLLANKQVEWLESDRAKEIGWSECTAGEAIDHAELGHVVIAGWFNPNQPPHNHGHIAIVVPAPVADGGVHIAQAGHTNYESTPIRHGFGSLPARFFFHP